jgi:uncharacterized protein
LEIWLLFIAAGLAAGFMAGLLGIGGGFVVVPVLIFTLPLAGIETSLTPHVAIGTSLLCICITALSSANAHHKKQAVNWQLVKLISPGLIVGALLGAAIAAYLRGDILIIIFVSGALITAFYLLSGHQPTAQPNQAKWPFFIYANFTGCISSLIGIGGGSVLVPFLVYKGQPMVKSVATAAACGFPIAVFGAVGYAISGWQQTQINNYLIGYLYLPAFLGIVIFSALSAPLGAKVAHFISAQRLRQLFAAFLFLTSAQILYSQWL